MSLTSQLRKQIFSQALHIRTLFPGPMRFGLPQLAVSSVLLRHLELVATGGNTSSLDGSGGDSKSSIRFSSSKKERASGFRENATIRVLSQEWMLQKCVFASDENVPYGRAVLVNRAYSSVAFQEVIKADGRSLDSAHALMLKQEEEASRLRSLMSDPLLCNKKFYSRYKYRQDEPGTQKEGKEAKTLQIPRYIRCSASTHRLVAVNILENKNKKDVVHNCLQLSYEDVPSQCECSTLFRPVQAEVLKARERSYGTPLSSRPRSCKHCNNTQVADSDGDTNVVKLSVATALTEWLGKGVCAQIGCGGYSKSHEGMVHAFLLLTPESSQLVKNFMDENALGIEEEVLENKAFVQTEFDTPNWGKAFLGFLNFNYFTSGRDRKYYPEVQGHTYRAVVSNHRQESLGVVFYGSEPEMMLLPTHNGVMTLGMLSHAYRIEEFGKYTKSTILRYSSAMVSLGSRIMNSPRHRVMRHRAAFEELMLDVNAANAEAQVRILEDGVRMRRALEEIKREAYEKTRRDAALSQFKDEAAEKMANAEKRVEEGAMAEADYIKLCSDLGEEYKVRERLIIINTE